MTTANRDHLPGHYDPCLWDDEDDDTTRSDVRP